MLARMTRVGTVSESTAAVTAPEVHYRLVQQRAWSKSQFTEWLDTTLTQQLLLTT
jgi:hypothetical protein